MDFVGNRLNEVSVGGITKVEHNSNRSVPSVAEHVSLPAEQVPQRRASEAGVVDAVEVKLGDRMTKVELLCQVIVLSDVLSSLHTNIMLHAIHFILQIISQMLARIYPGKIIATKLHIWQVPFLLHKCQAFCLTFPWIRISAELEIM